MSTKNFPGSVELISGITPKNGGDFPLVDAEDVIIYENAEDQTGMRLPQKLKEIGIKPEEKLELIGDAVEEVFGDSRFVSVNNSIFRPSTEEGGGTVNRIEELEEAVSELQESSGQVDMSTLKMTYTDTNSTLYLHHQDTIPEFDDDNNLTNPDKMYTSAIVSDNSKIKLLYDKSVSLLYLYDTAEFDPSNVIASVEIQGGSNSGGLGLTLSLAALNTQSFATKLGDKTEIQFKGVLKDSDQNESTGLPVEFEVYVNNDLKKTLSGQDYTSGKPISLDVTEYILSESTYNIQIRAKYSDYVTNPEDGTQKLLTIYSGKVAWNIQAIDLGLSIDNTFQSKTEVVQTQDLMVEYTLKGNVAKTTYFKINGDRIYAQPTSTAPGRKTTTLKIADFEHGSYTLEIYTSAILNGKEVETDHFVYSIMFGKKGNSEPIIRLASSSLVGEQYSELPLSFTIYKEGALNHDYTLSEEYTDEKGATVIKVLEKGSVKDNTPKNDYQYYTEIPGSKKIILESEGKIAYLNVEILPTTIEVDPVLSGLALDFSPKGRSNSAEDYNVFYNNAFDSQGNELPITWELSDNFDWVNGGWQTDKDGNSFFCVKAGTTATINYNLFEDTDTYTATQHGKEFKIIFKTSNVTDTSNAFFSCSGAAETGTKNVGIVLKPHDGTISSNFDTLELPYSEEDIIELDFNITPFSNITYESVNIPMIMTYEDGAPFRPLPYTSTSTSFNQTNPVPITIGSPTCDVHIYRMKAYTTYLADEFILNNFILDAKNGAEMKERYNRNNISFNGVITQEMIESNAVDAPLKKFAEENPQLRIIGIEAPHFTKSKSNKVAKSKFYYYYAGGRKNEDNWVAENCVHNGQGTSSNNYRFSGKNLDLNMKQKAGTVYTITIEAASGLYDKDGKFYEKGTVVNEKMDFYTAADETIREKIAYEELHPTYATVVEEEVPGSVITLADGTITDKITLTETSVPTNYLNIKVNIASSENANNSLLAKRYNRYLPYTSGASKRDPLVKNSMEFYNCVIFIRETNEDKNGQGVYLSHQEFNDTNWHFYAIGNIGDSKKTDSSRVTDKKDDKEFCQEILDVTRPLARFPINTIFKASEILDEDGNPTFLMDKKYLPNLLEFVDFKYIPTADEDYVEGKTYYVDMLENDDYSGQYTYEARYSTDAEEKAEWATMKQTWNNFYRFVTRDLTYDDKRLSSELKDTTQTSILKAAEVKDVTGKHIFLSDAATYLPHLLEYTKEGYVKTKDTDYVEGKTYYVALLDDPAKVEQWKKDFETWFIKESAFYYYLFTLRYTMVDNWAKNSFWHYGKDATGQYKFEFWDYDNDTALGIDNTGTLKMPYGVEGHDKDENGGERFRASDSTFFTRIIKYFSKEITAFYETIQVNSYNEAFDSDHFIEEFDAWQQLFPEELWRWDYNRKYKRTYIGGYGLNWDNAKNPLLTEAQKQSDGIYLKEMMYGRKKYQRRQFERNQGFYMSSKFNDSDNQGDKIELRFGNPGEDAEIKPDYTLYLTPYLNMYLNVYNGNNRYFYDRCTAGVPVKVPFSGSSADFIYIQGASNLQSTGDLSLTYTDQANFSGAGRLKDIILGTNLPGFKNGFLETLGVDGSNKALETLNIQNYINEKISTPKTEDLINLKYLYAQGSKIQTVEFANRGLMEEAYLPETISSITALNLYNFHTLECEGLNNLSSLAMVNCPRIADSVLTIVQNAPNLNRIRLTNIKWTIDNSAILERLYNCAGFDEDGHSKVEHAYLAGDITLTGTITRYNLDKYRARWPELTITPTSDNLIIEQQWVRFWSDIPNDDPEKAPVLLAEILVNVDEILEQRSLIGGQYVTLTYDPTVENNLSGIKIDIPTKPNSADGQHKYVYTKWADESGAGMLDKIIEKGIDLNYYARFTEQTRTYQVNWLNGDGSILAYLPNIEYGSAVDFNNAYDANIQVPTLISKLPTKANQLSVWFLFKGWDQSTSAIYPERNAEGTDYLDIVTIKPIFEEVNAARVKDKIIRPGTGTTGDETLVLTAGDLYAVAKDDIRTNSSRMNTDVFNLRNSAAKDKIQIQLGYMPSYENVDETVIIGEGSIKGYDSWECKGTDAPDSLLLIPEINPFADDCSFTLAIDFTAKHNGNTGDSADKYLVSAYSYKHEYGFNLTTNNTTGPKITWGTVSNKNNKLNIPIGKDKPPKAMATNPLQPIINHREICIIRKKKGDPKLYLFTNDRYSLEGVLKQALPEAPYKPDIAGDIYLCLGGLINDATNKIINFATGTIHNAKIWWTDLSDEECERICAWTYEKMNFIYSNSNNNGEYTPRYEDANKVGCLASFMAETLLPEPVTYDEYGSATDKNYHETSLKQWITQKFYKALPIDWQQVLTPVNIPALGVYDEFGNFTRNGVMSSYDKLYIPSVIEVDAEQNQDTSPYSQEATQVGTFNSYPQFADNASRKYGFPNTDTPTFWALRSAHADRQDRRVGITSEGVVGMRDTYKYQGTDQQISFDMDEKYGILIGFSI